MTLYVDASALVKRYLPHSLDHERCIEVMDAHQHWITSRITTIEAPRALARTAQPNIAVQASLDADTAEMVIVELDHGIAALARAVAIETGVRTLDAIHIASAKAIPDPDLEFLTYDDRQKAAAEAMGLTIAR